MAFDLSEDGAFLTFLIAARFIRESLCAYGSSQARVIGIKKNGRGRGG
jgi:hypothetical protein